MDLKHNFNQNIKSLFFGIFKNILTHSQVKLETDEPHTFGPGGH